MPRYYVDTNNDRFVFDDVGTELPDRIVLQQEVRKMLTGIMHDEANGERNLHVRADARDEDGKRVLTATLVLSVDVVG